MLGIATPSVLLVLASGAALAEDFAPAHQGNAPSATELNKVRKFGKLPIKIQLAAQSVVARPVLPKWIEGNLADPDNLRFGLEN